MIQVYTGKGKGKTTASLGLALRAVGAGLKVYIAQFCKSGRYSEIKVLKKIKGIKLEQFGRACFIKRKILREDRELAKKGLEKIKKIAKTKNYDMIILDEINIALHFKLLDTIELIELLRSIPKDKEIVITGRYAPKEIIKIADLVSEVKEIKHYYRKGIKARKGIEF
ncbi:MAG: cob(I)yrinic acid a,c-diamide adenosyltransferase [Candidatus Omnitrophica bacterium]|nr:cob(I)yrinic acid a,c-diamide adenosyltransferase [Candidatus Omnitrophota bacterium]